MLRNEVDRRLLQAAAEAAAKAGGSPELARTITMVTPAEALREAKE